MAPAAVLGTPIPAQVRQPFLCACAAPSRRALHAAPPPSAARLPSTPRAGPICAPLPAVARALRGWRLAGGGRSMTRPARPALPRGNPEPPLSQRLALHRTAVRSSTDGGAGEGAAASSADPSHLAARDGEPGGEPGGPPSDKDAGGVSGAVSAAGRQVAQPQRLDPRAVWTQLVSRRPGGELEQGHVPTSTGSHVTRAAGEWWRTAHPVTKWPLVIFGPVLLAVTAIAGPPAAVELLPLWILGPLLLGAAIRFVLGCAALVTAALAWRGAVAARSRELLAYSSSGRLLEDAGAAAARVREEVRRLADEAGGKKDALVVYARSGRLAEDARGRAARLAREQAERARVAVVTWWEDFIDWARPARRRTIKFLQKVF